MKLHVFNPEHDIALAFNRATLTSPHAARELRMNLGWMPALWASPGDVVLVDDVAFAIKAAASFRREVSEVLFVNANDLRMADMAERSLITGVEPWGWDVTIRQQLRNAHISEDLLPSLDDLVRIREMSSRVWAMEHVQKVLKPFADGVLPPAMLYDDIAALRQMTKEMPAEQTIVMKAPWSSSGRGVRYVTGKITASNYGWAHHTISQQGCVMIEPYYNKVADFAAEFICSEDGVRFSGLSVFYTQNGAYTGNVIASESDKRALLTRHVSNQQIDEAVETVREALNGQLAGRYEGPLGVDMMIIPTPGDNGVGDYMIHPFVELNLRRTMGHVALSLHPEPVGARQVMKIDRGVNYRLTIAEMDNNFVNVV